MPRERAGTGPHQLESPKSSVSSGSSCGRISPGGGVASVLAETITSRRAQQQQPQQQELQAESARRRHLALPATGASRQRRRPGPLSVESDWHDEPFGAALKPDPHRIPAAARSARDLRPRHLGLVKFPGDLDSWGGDSARAHVRAVSVRGGESLVELNTLHKLAERRAAQLQRHKSLALAVWDGRHDLVSAEELGSTQAAGQAEETCWPLCTSVPALSLMLVLCGCGSQLPYELMNSVDRGCGALIAVCEAAFGLAATAPVALRQHSWSVPLPTHACVAGVAVLYPLLLNQALASPLPVVLLSTLKNGNLVANALVGMLLLGKRYSSRQLVSIAVVSGGLVLTALSARASSGRQDDSGAGADVLLTREGVVAAGCLAGALLARALSGGLQEAAFAKCDGTRASADEMLFFQNLFGKSTNSAIFGCEFSPRFCCEWTDSRASRPTGASGAGSVVVQG